MRAGGPRGNRPAPPAITGGHFDLALWAWLVLAVAVSAQLGGDMASTAPATTTGLETSAASRPSLEGAGVVPPPPPPPTAASKPLKASKRAIDPTKRPNDVYAPTNGSFDYYKLQVYWPSSIFKPQQ